VEQAFYRDMFNSALLLLAAQTAALAPPAGRHETDAQTAWPAQIQHDLKRLGRVEWQMRRRAADQCPKTAAGAGIVIDYLGAYDPADRSLVRRITGLRMIPLIIAVAPDSPAEAAGLRIGDEITGLGTLSIARLKARSSDPALLADAIQDRIAAHRPNSDLAFTIMRNGKQMRLSVRLDTVCSARFILQADDTIAAYSDGEHVAVTTGIMRFARGDDELALIAGHELAHVIADGKRRTGLFGRRKIEDRADLLGARLAHCAGYNMERAVDFWARFAKRDRLGFLRSPSHRSASGREKRLRAASHALSCPATP